MSEEQERMFRLTKEDYIRYFGIAGILVSPHSGRTYNILPFEDLELAPLPEKEIRKKFRFYIEYDYNPVQAMFMAELFPCLREEWREHVNKKLKKQSSSAYLSEEKKES